MSEIKKIYRQTLPEMQLVGRKYYEKDKVNGTFSNQWGEWFGKNLFEPLHIAGNGAEPFTDCDAFIGLSKVLPDGNYEYWIGVFLPTCAKVPAGYESLPIKASDIAVCWVYGKEPDIYFHCCLSALKENGFEWTADENGVKLCFERYTCPRFTEPDKQGNRILDQCFFVK